MRTVTRMAALALGLAQAATAGAVGAQTPATAPQRPPQAQCEAVRDIDLRTLERELAARRAAAADRAAAAGQAGAAASDMLDVVRVSDRAARRPPEDASIVIRARMPPGGGYSSDHRSVVWREADGSWWF